MAGTRISSFTIYVTLSTCSGEELFKSLRPVDIGLPQTGGQKHYCPEDTWLQEKQLQLFYRERRQVLDEERIAKL